MFNSEEDILAIEDSFVCPTEELLDLEKMLQKSREGKAWADIMIGDIYARGIGVETDPAEAIRWYRKAVKRGESFGHECIGGLYYEGKIVPRDFRKAFRYFNKVKEERAFCTLFALGEMYRLGLYVKKNRRAACRYYWEIVLSNGAWAEADDYYWQACCRLAVASHYGVGVSKDLSLAAELLHEAAHLFDKWEKGKTENAVSEEELFREYYDLFCIDFEGSIDADKVCDCREREEDETKDPGYYQNKTEKRGREV